MSYKKIAFSCAFIVATLIVGFFDAREPDDLAYVVAVGIDAAQNEENRYTFQFVNPLKMSGGGEGGGSAAEALSVVEMEGKNLYDAADKINNFLSKEITFSQTKLIVFGEEEARQDISQHIDSFMRQKEFHPNTFVAVARGSAYDYLDGINPPLEANPVKHYEMVFRQGYTSHSISTTLRELYYDSHSPDIEAAVVYVLSDNKEGQDTSGAQPSKSQTDETGEKNMIQEQNPNTSSEQQPKERTEGKEKSDLQSDLLGIAYLRGSQVVGVADEAQAKTYHMIKGDLYTSYHVFPLPNSSQVFSAMVSQAKKPKYHVELINGVPKISVELFLNADITSLSQELSTVELEQEMEQTFVENCTALLYQSARELKSDVFGFGRAARPHFLTWEAFSAYQWAEHYPQAQFTVEAEVTVKNTGTLLKNLR